MAKFKLGDKVATINGKTGKVVEFEVEKITTEEDADGITVYYSHSGDYTDYEEERCFSTREELLNYIIS